MANFVPGSLKVVPGNESLVAIKYTMARFVYWDAGSFYLHYKTNIPKQTDIMFMLEAVGYSYAGAQAIRCSWCGYSYSRSYTILNSGVHTAYPGLTAHSMYYSADGFVVIVAYGAVYCSGWTFNSYALNPAGFAFDIQITASAQAATATYY